MHSLDFIKLAVSKPLARVCQRARHVRNESGWSRGARVDPIGVQPGAHRGRNVVLPFGSLSFLLRVENSCARPMQVTLAAAHARLFHFRGRKCADGIHLHAARQPQKSPHNFSLQCHVRASIIAQDDGHGAIVAQRGLPTLRVRITSDQAAFLHGTPSKEILVIKATLLTVRSFHPHPQPLLRLATGEGSHKCNGPPVLPMGLCTLTFEIRDLPRLASRTHPCAYQSGSYRPH